MSEKLETYEQVADFVRLPYVTRMRYLLYMRMRWPGEIDTRTKCLAGYAEEWAWSFKNGLEYDYSDSWGKDVLYTIDQRGGGDKPETKA